MTGSRRTHLRSIAGGVTESSRGDALSPLLQAMRDDRPMIIRFLAARGVASPEDVYQELWAKFLRETPPAVDSPSSYILRCANNLVIDQVRANQQRIAREQAFHTLSDIADPMAPEVSRSDRIIAARQELEAVRAAISSLGEKTAAIFFRFRIDGRTRPEIAAEFSLSVSAVEKHLARAYRKLIELRQSDEQ